MRTITGAGISVKANNSKRTYTIRREGFKYRTYQMTREEFASTWYWTANDWQHFLKTDEYFRVKK